MNILVFLSCLIYLSYSDSSDSGDSSESADNNGCADYCDLSYNDTSTSLSTCPSAEFILNLYYDGFIEAGLHSAEEIKTYFEPYYDSEIIYRTNGKDKWIGLDSLSQGFVVQTWSLTRKEAYNLKNERYGSQYVAVDYEVSFENICGDYIDNVQSFAIYYCDESGKISNIHVLRDKTDTQQFQINTVQCIALNSPPNGALAPALPFMIKLKSPWVVGLGCLLVFVLICNIILMCMKCNGGGNKGYSGVKHVDSEDFDDSEANPINGN